MGRAMRMTRTMQSGMCAVRLQVASGRVKRAPSADVIARLTLAAVATLRR